jgi:hypothetical protein
MSRKISQSIIVLRLSFYFLFTYSNESVPKVVEVLDEKEIFRKFTGPYKNLG